MTSEISIKPAGGTWVVRAGGAVLGETAEALELTEGANPPVIYFPRADIGMAFLDKSASHTDCPAKGAASYYSIVTKSEVLKDAAWSYETPKEAASRIAGHLAFHPSSKVTVEKL